MSVKQKRFWVGKVLSHFIFIPVAQALKYNNQQTQIMGFQVNDICPSTSKTSNLARAVPDMETLDARRVKQPSLPMLRFLFVVPRTLATF